MWARAVSVGQGQADEAPPMRRDLGEGASPEPVTATTDTYAKWGRGKSAGQGLHQVKGVTTRITSRVQDPARKRSVAICRKSNYRHHLPGGEYVFPGDGASFPGLSWR